MLSSHSNNRFRKAVSIDLSEVKDFSATVQLISNQAKKKHAQRQNKLRNGFLYCLRSLLSSDFIPKVQDLTLYQSLEMIWKNYLNFKSHYPKKAEFLHQFLKIATMFGDYQFKRDIDLVLYPLSNYFHTIIPAKGKKQGMSILYLLLLVDNQVIIYHKDEKK